MIVDAKNIEQNDVVVYDKFVSQLHCIVTT